MVPCFAVQVPLASISLAHQLSFVIGHSLQKSLKVKSLQERLIEMKLQALNDIHCLCARMCRLGLGPLLQSSGERKRPKNTNRSHTKHALGHVYIAILIIV